MDYTKVAAICGIFVGLGLISGINNSRFNLILAGLIIISDQVSILLRS